MADQMLPWYKLPQLKDSVTIYAIATEQFEPLLDLQVQVTVCILH